MSKPVRQVRIGVISSAVWLLVSFPRPIAMAASPAISFVTKPFMLSSHTNLSTLLYACEDFD